MAGTLKPEASHSGDDRLRSPLPPADLPRNLPAELVQTLVSAGSHYIERIVSHGRAWPEGLWYDQNPNEWVVLLKGAATLRFDDRTVDR